MLIFKEAFRTIARTLGTWTMSVLTFAIALGVAGLFLLLAWKAHSEMKRLAANLSIEAYFDPALSSDAAALVAERDVKRLEGVNSAVFVSKEQALEDYAKSSGENVENVLGMNPLPASVTVSLREPSVAATKSIIEKLRAIAGITEVQSDLGLLRAMEARARALDTVAWMLGGLLSLSALFFAFMSGKLTVASRGETLHTMTLMGATRRLLIGPFVIEYAIAGLLGGLLAVGLILLVQQEAFAIMGAGMDLHFTRETYTLLISGGAIAGMLLGSSGSLAAALNRDLGRLVD